jgi:hypothetical protein
MTTAGWVALAITVFGAVNYAAASLLQAVAARRSTSLAQTLRHPLYLLGLGCDVMAWVGSMIALQQLAVYLVESILAGSLAVTVIGARLILKSRLRRCDLTAVGVTIIALTVLAMSAGPQHDVAMSAELRAGFCAAALAVALLGWGANKAAVPPGVIAAIGGLGMGGAALVGRSLTLPETQGAGELALAIVTEPLFVALLVFAATGMMSYANALQRGQVGPVTAVLWTAEVATPSAVALLFLGDSVRPDWYLPAAVAGVVTVCAAVLLATAPATSATAHPAEQPAPPALPATGAPAQPVAAQPVPRRSAERVIWWGPPPIWIPPSRTIAALTGRSAPALTWTASQTTPALWTAPQPPDAVADEVAVPQPRVPVRPPPEIFVAEPVRPTPWHDLRRAD